jgi:hypothetical protein
MVFPDMTARPLPWNFPGVHLAAMHITRKGGASTDRKDFSAVLLLTLACSWSLARKGQGLRRPQGFLRGAASGISPFSELGVVTQKA